jgi:hypothetical protein
MRLPGLPAMLKMPLPLLQAHFPPRHESHRGGFLERTALLFRIGRPKMIPRTSDAGTSSSILESYGRESSRHLDPAKARFEEEQRFLQLYSPKLSGEVENMFRSDPGQGFSPAGHRTDMLYDGGRWLVAELQSVSIKPIDLSPPRQDPPLTRFPAPMSLAEVSANATSATSKPPPQRSPCKALDTPKSSRK